MKSSPASAPEISTPSLEAKPALRPITNPVEVTSTPPLERILEEKTAELELISLAVTDDNFANDFKVVKLISALSDLPSEFTAKALRK